MRALRPTALAVLCLLVAACSAPPFLARTSPASATDERGSLVQAPDPKLQARLDRALEADQAQQWSAALAGMDSIWREDSSLWSVALNAALICDKQGDDEAAQQWFQRAIQSSAASPVTRNEYAIYLRRQGRFAEAQEQYQLALQAAPEYAVSHYNLAILYDLYTGDKPRALQHFTLYQSLTAEEDRQVKGWIADLRRQQQASGVGSGGAR